MPSEDFELIYRFRHFNFQSEAHSSEPEQLIGESQLWCADPANLNDPFDCNPYFVMSNIPIDEQIRRAEAMIDRRGLRRDHPLAVRVLSAAQAGRMSTSEMQNALVDGMRNSIQRSSVCCFSSNWQDPRMWAQYADNHRGYCLRFRVDGEWPEEAIPMPVKYTADRLQIDLAIDTMRDTDAAWKSVEDSVFTKSEHWSGELEVRIFRPDIGAGLQAFPPASLEALYLGMHISEPNRERLLQAARKRPSKLTVFQLRPNAHRYDFDLEEVK